MRFLSSCHKVFLLALALLFGAVGESVANEEPQFRLELEVSGLANL